MGPVEYFLIAVLILGISIACYGWGAAIAERKGYARSMGWWAFAFSLPGLAALYLMPDASQRQRRSTARQAPPSGTSSFSSDTSQALRTAPQSARFCIECGTANASGGRFCTECGVSLAAVI